MKIYIKGSRLSEQRKIACNKYYYRIKFTVMQHYSKKSMPICERCGCDDLRILDMHHPDKNRQELMAEAGIAKTQNITYWKWLIDHKFPKKHRVEIVCVYCHKYMHIWIRPKLVRSMNYWLRGYRYERTVPYPLWFIERVKEEGHKLLEKDMQFDGPIVEFWNLPVKNKPV